MPHVTDQSMRRFKDFYPFYLGEHSNRNCRRLHFLGSSLAIAALIMAIASARAWWLLGAPVAGYGCAWIGHLLYEKNRPATFRYPLYSFIGDWVMFKDILMGRIPF